MVQKSYPDTTAVNYTYDNDSRLTQVTDPTGTYQFTFDNMGRLTGTTTSYSFLTGRNFTTSYGGWPGIERINNCGHGVAERVSLLHFPGKY